MENILPIPGYENYFASPDGRIFSNKKGYLKEMVLWADSRNRYLMVGLTIECKTVKKELVHRLIAKTFIPNPENLPEINHKDKNTKNNNVSNLEWCTREKNLRESYETMSPTRNFRECFLYKRNEIIGEFQSIKQASEFASEKYGASYSSLTKYNRWGEYSIFPKTVDFNTIEFKVYNTRKRDKSKV